MAFWQIGDKAVAKESHKAETTGDEIVKGELYTVNGVDIHCNRCKNFGLTLAGQSVFWPVWFFEKPFPGLQDLLDLKAPSAPESPPKKREKKPVRELEDA